MFYSHPSLRLEFILFAVLSTHFLLHQYFISSLPLSSPHLLFTLFLSFSSFHFALSLSLLPVMFLCCSWHLQSLWPTQFFFTPKVSLPLISSFPPLLFSSFVFHLESFVFLLSCSAPSRSRGLLRWWTKAVCCRWSSTLSFSPRWVSWGCVQTLRGPRVFTSAC